MGLPRQVAIRGGNPVINMFLVSMSVNWYKTRTAIQFLFVTTGVLLSASIAVALFGYVRSSPAHYSSFVLGIVIMSGLLGLRNMLDEHLQDNRARYFHIRCIVTVAGFILAATGAVYIRYNVSRLELLQPFFENIDVVYGLIFTAGILLLTLLHWGVLLTSIIALAIVYFFYGHHIDNVLFTHPHYQTGFVMNYIGLGTTQGFFLLTQLAADSIYFLLIYASVLISIGALQMALELGKVSGKKVAGGAAYPAILGSGIVASVMGQAVSNVVLTGRFTIPMMKKNGYSASMAGAIEAVASTAGQLMPPILGLAGFLIAALLNIPYIKVAGAALLPALLFLTGIFISVSLYARRQQIPKLTDNFDAGSVLRIAPTFVVSFAVVLVMLLMHYSPSIAGMCGIAAALALSMFQGRYRPTAKKIFGALEEGLVLVTLLSLLIIAIGPLGQTMITTNLSGRLGSVLVNILPDAPLLLLVGAMFITLILGMGLPTPVAYVVTALAVVPFLQQLGFPAFQSHFFVFYFAVFSTLTLPIAVGVLAAAKLAGSRFIPTAINALKLTFPVFLIPFAVIYKPEISMIEDWTWRTPLLFAALVVIQACIAAAIFGPASGHSRPAQRAFLLLVSLAGFYYLFLS